MFVQGNTLQDLKTYFQRRLGERFSASELQLIVKEVVCKRLKMNYSDYFTNRNIRFSESDLLYFREVVHRLLADEPFQHVTGETEFYGLVLATDKRALIPRPETEELVDWICAEYAGFESVKLLDACSGSGCIALAVKSTLKDAQVVAVEFSAEALSLIRENMQKTGLTVRVEEMDVLRENCFSGFEQESFDVWVSNPPYIPRRDSMEMEANVLKYEPAMALFVPNEDPMLFYRKLAQDARMYLKPGGSLFFEIHERYASAVSEVLEKTGFIHIELRKDLQGKERMVRAQKRNFTA